MTHLTREDMHTAIATLGFRAPQVPTVVVPEGYLEVGKKAFGADAHVVESKRSRAQSLLFMWLYGSRPILCHRCGSLWDRDETEHADGVYCPRCPDYKDEHNSLEERSAR